VKIKRVTDKEINKYGRIISLDTAEIVKAAEHISFPEKGANYIASVKEFEKLEIMNDIQNRYFGGMETQLGYCYGYNNELAALEWHKCSEINIATKDLILLLGDMRDISGDMKYDSSKVEAFRLNKGEAIEVYATTLHYCPISVSGKGFGAVVGLIKHTNTPIDFECNDKILFQKNKWLLCHEESKGLIKDGAVVGITGENFKL